MVALRNSRGVHTWLDGELLARTVARQLGVPLVAFCLSISTMCLDLLVAENVQAAVPYLSLPVLGIQVAVELVDVFIAFSEHVARHRDLRPERQWRCAPRPRRRAKSWMWQMSL